MLPEWALVTSEKIVVETSSVDLKHYILTMQMDIKMAC